MSLIPRTLMVAAALLMTGGSVALAEPANQAATATPTPVACTVPPQGVVIVLENPQPGASFAAGQSIVMNGAAYDVTSTSGPGVDSVTAYLGSRDAGGVFLGTASLGQPSGPAGGGSAQANAGFTLRTSSLPTGSGQRDLFVYAHSSVSGREANVSVPIFLGPAPTPVRGQVPTPVLPPPPVCTPTPAPTATATPVPPLPTLAPTSPPAPPSAPVAATPLPTLAPLPPAPLPTVAPAAAAPAPAAVAPAATTAPRGGGIPSELGLPLLALGALIFGGGYALRRRERRASAAKPSE